MAARLPYAYSATDKDTSQFVANCIWVAQSSTAFTSATAFGTYGWAVTIAAGTLTAGVQVLTCTKSTSGQAIFGIAIGYDADNALVLVQIRGIARVRYDGSPVINEKVYGGSTAGYVTRVASTLPVTAVSGTTGTGTLTGIVLGYGTVIALGTDADSVSVVDLLIS